MTITANPQNVENQHLTSAAPAPAAEEAAPAEPPADGKTTEHVVYPTNDLLLFFMNYSFRFIISQTFISLMPITQHCAIYRLDWLAYKYAWAGLLAIDASDQNQCTGRNKIS